MGDLDNNKNDKSNQESSLHFEDVEVEILEVQRLIEYDSRFDLTRQEINHVLELLEQNYSIETEINIKLDPFNDGADKLDYLIAISSGFLAGLIDAIWVGSFDFTRGREWGKEKVNGFVKSVARFDGYEGADLEGSIRYLEKKFGLASDSVTSEFGGGLQHHVRDFSHHPNLVGLSFSMLTQFTGFAYGTDAQGNFISVKIEDRRLIGKDFSQKLLFGMIYWLFHMVSDMAGSSSNPGEGTGLPGPILSFLKELSSLPFFEKHRNEEDTRQLSLWVSRLFNGTLFAEHDKNGKIIYDSAKSMRFDLRAEIGVGEEMSRQVLPVYLNDTIVRAFYFLRQLKLEFSEKKIHRFGDLKQIDWKRVRPSNNRKIMRMLTVSRGTMTAIDIWDAGVQGFVRNHALNERFLKDFILRVNIIGVGKFLVSVGTEFSSSKSRNDLLIEKINIYRERTQLVNSQLNFKQSEVWISAKTSAETLQDVIKDINHLTKESLEYISEGSNVLMISGDQVKSMMLINEGVINELTEVIKGEGTYER